VARHERFVSVDIEADGPIPGEYSMLSLGAAYVDEPSRTFYTELSPISDTFVPESLAVSGLDRDALARAGASPGSAMQAFVDWVDDAPGKPVFVSFSTWDWVFVYYYLIRFVGRSPFGHSSLDLKSLYMGVHGTSWAATGKRHIARVHPELLEGLGPHSHNALEDAVEQAGLCRRLFDQATSTRPLG
jgi:hypothetical protein